MIRPRTPADLAALERALRAVHEAERYPRRWPADPAAWFQPAGLLGAWVAAAPDGEVSGHVLLRPPPADATAQAAMVATGLQVDGLAFAARLFVVPAARGTGVGAALLNTAREEARWLGLRAALDVDTASLNAVALYDRLGWQRIATVPDAWQIAQGTDASLHVYVAPE
ncbi:GNAT family N-acetyltransferase [Deinococcus sp. MIMF12]|uniref:GNAT family N-acetyltransferase n=1 Tax=Deinococcus rhizophilus TaxID=3049544 RepID=A0ABT7JF55_9DEIO|nr:GNAT family N-acetyltransferase [Deinococcus rhizophilus]MDL2343571.1 GNAT family N-acetyltransferase [Deinococcus rhizophilus]